MTFTLIFFSMLMRVILIRVDDVLEVNNPFSFRVSYPTLCTTGGIGYIFQKEETINLSTAGLTGIDVYSERTGQISMTFCSGSCSSGTYDNNERYISFVFDLQEDDELKFYKIASNDERINVNYVNAPTVHCKKWVEVYQGKNKYVFVNKNDPIILDFVFPEPDITLPITINAILYETNHTEINNNEIIDGAPRITRRSYFDISSIELPLNEPLSPFVFYDSIYYTQDTSFNFYLDPEYTFSSKCQTSSNFRDIVVTFTSHNVPLSTFGPLRIGLIDLSKESGANDTNAKYIFHKEDFTVGNFLIEIKDVADGKFYPVNYQNITIIDDYTIKSVTTQITSVFISIEFMFPLVSSSVDLSMKLRQSDLTVTDFECGVDTADASKKTAKCKVGNAVKQFKEGVAVLYITTPICDTSQKFNSKTVQYKVEIKGTSISQAKFEFAYPEIPVMMNNNIVEITSQSLYEISKITQIKVKVTTYKDVESIVTYTKDSDDDYSFTYSATEDKIKLNLFYLTGDLLSIIELSDDYGKKTFNELENVFAADFPFVFLCAPIIFMNVQYECEIHVADWGVRIYNYEIISLYKIEMTDSRVYQFTYCHPQGTCSYELTLEQNYYSFHFTSTVPGPYVFLKLLANNPKISKTFTYDQDGYPYIIQECYNELSYVNYIFVEKAADGTDVIHLEYTEQGLLFVNDKYHRECMAEEDDPTMRTCTLREEVDNFLILYYNVYYVQEPFKKVTFSTSTNCLNSIDNNELVITVTSAIEDIFDGYEAYFNTETTNTVTGVKVTPTKYTFTFPKAMLSNKDYTKFYIVKDTDIGHTSTINNLFYYVDNTLDSFSAPSFTDGAEDQEIIFTFADDVSHIVAVVLTDSAVDVEEEFKYVYPSEECTQNLYQEKLTCIYDMKKYFGSEYQFSFVTSCNSAMIPTGLSINPQLDTSTLYIILLKETYLINTNVEFYLRPKTSDTILYVLLSNSTDSNPVDTDTNDAQGKITFTATSQSGYYDLSVATTTMTATAKILLYEYHITISCEEVVLPLSSMEIESMNIILRVPIIVEQIEEIKFDSLDCTFEMSARTIIKATFPNPVQYTSKEEHVITVKEKGTDDLHEVHIKVVDAPTFEIPQTAFIADSDNKILKVYVEDPEQIVIENVYESTAGGYLGFDDGYTYPADIFLTATKHLYYKVYEYYYPIPYEFAIVNKTYNEIFENLIFEQCSLLKSSYWIIDLTLTEAGKLIFSPAKIRLEVTNDKGEKINFELFVPYLYKYKSKDIQPGRYDLKLFYSTDTIEFYTRTFSLTSFDQLGKENSIQIVNNIFRIEFTNMFCDPSATDIKITDNSLVDLPLSGSYSNHKFLLVLSSPNQYSSLYKGKFKVRSSEYIVDINLSFVCVDPIRKLYVAANLCVENCILLGLKDAMNNCVSSCPINTYEIQSFCINGDPVIKTNSTDIVIEDDLDELIQTIKDNIKDFSDIGKTITNGSQIIQVYPYNETIDDPDGKASVITSLGECESILKNFYNIPSSESLIILKIDTVTPDEATNKVSYEIYSMKGEKLDLSKCSNVTIDISYPINDGVNLTYGEEMSQDGIDIFDPTDEFFNNICYSYQTSNNKDIILKDRRNYIYQNVSFCDSGCQYVGINYETKRVNCICVVPTGEEDEKKELTFREFTTNIFSNNIAIIKCIKEILLISVKNVGFWLTLTALVVILVLLIMLFIRDIKRLRKKIDRKMKEFLPSQITNSNIANKLNTNESIGSQKPLINNQMKLLNKKITPEWGKQTDTSVEIFESLFDDLHNKKDNHQVINVVNIKVGKVVIKNQISCNKLFTLETNEDATPKQANEEVTPKGPKRFPNPVNENAAFPPLLCEKPSSKLIFTKDTCLHKCTTEVISDMLRDAKLLGMPHKPNNFTYERACVEDKRNFCETFCSFLKEKHEYCKIIFPGSKYDIRSLSLSILFFKLVLTCALNGVFYTDSQLSERYKKGTLTFLQDLLRSVPSSLISTVISLVNERLINASPYIEVLLIEVKSCAIVQLMQRLLRKCFRKMILFYIMNLLILVVFMYYVTLFCIIYPATQMSWFIGCVYSIILNNLVSVGICFCLTMMRQFGLVFKNKTIYNLQLFISDIFKNNVSFT